MATSSAIKGQGTTIGASTNLSTPAYTLIANVKNIDGIGSGESNDIDITHLTSSAKEYTTGLKDEGTITLTLDFDPDDAGQTMLQTALDNSSMLAFEVTLPSTYGKFTFKGTPKSFSKPIAVDAVITSSVSIKISGAVTFA